jgi:hypothetical protein
VDIVYKIEKYIKESGNFEETINKWYDSSRQSKKDTKIMYDLLWLVGIYKKKGQIKLDYRDNVSGNVVAYVGNTSVSGDTINKAYDIGIESIFKA